MGNSTRLDRALYWSGNWIHLLRPLEAASLSDETRRTVLKWLGFFALAGCITGLIIGWQHWRPGWGGRQTYSQGHVHPYREFWLKWHFWTKLIGGIFALLWALSGYLNGNPFGLFSPTTRERTCRRRCATGSLQPSQRRPSARESSSWPDAAWATRRC